MQNLTHDSAIIKNSRNKLDFKKIINLKNFNILLLAMIITGGIYYLAGVNDITIKGFSLQELNKKSRTLAAENKDMEQRVFALQSYENLQGRAQKLSMVSAGEISYITPGTGAVARR